MFGIYRVHGDNHLDVEKKSPMTLRDEVERIRREWSATLEGDPDPAHPHACDSEWGLKIRQDVGLLLERVDRLLAEREKLVGWVKKQDVGRLIASPNHSRPAWEAEREALLKEEEPHV